MMRNILLRFVLALSLITGVSACGFKPLHSTGDTASVMKNVTVESTTEDEIGFLLKQSLRDRISGASPKYVIVVSPTLSRRSLGISADDVASRYDLNASVKYELQDIATRKVLLKDRVTAVSTFGAPLDPYGRTAAESDARERVAREAGDRILIEVARFLKTQP